VHHCQYSNLVGTHGVQHAVRKALTESLTNLAPHDGCPVRVHHDRLGAALHFSDERAPKARPFEFVILRRVVELAFGQLVERDAHVSDPSPCVAKHFVRRSRLKRSRIERRAPSLGLFSPDLCVLFGRQFVEALKKSTCEPRAPFRIEPEHFGLKFFDSHDSILRSFCRRATGYSTAQRFS
jgi:hypothetical protein